MKKRIVGIALSILLGASLTGCGSASPEVVKAEVESENTSINAEASSETSEESQSQTEDDQEFTGEGLNTTKVIHAGYQGSDALYWLNKRFHWLEDEFQADGITVEFEQFLSGPPMIESIAADRLDISNIGDMPPINARGNGIDVKVVSKVINTPFSNSIVTPKGSEIKSIADLKGKKVATQVGSSGHHFISLLLEKEGLSLDDIELVNLSAPDQLAALESGEVAAVSTWEPYGSQATNKGVGTIFIDSTGIKQNTSTLVARNKFAEENPEILARYLKVWLKYLDYIDANREEALKIISEESGFEIDDIKRTYLEGLLNPEFTDYDYEQEKLTKDFLISTGTLENDYDINDLFEFKYLERAKKLYEEEK